jgi:septum site-determining protein MinC
MNDEVSASESQQNLPEPGAAALESDSPVRDQEIEFKGLSLSVMTMRLYTGDMDVIARQLTQKLASARRFYEHAPVLLDVGPLAVPRTGRPLPEQPAVLPDLRILRTLLHRNKLHLLGVLDGVPGIREQAMAADLPVLPKRRWDAAAHPVIAPELDPSTMVTPVKFVDHPVRGGQRVFAKGTHLTIMGPVNGGAEVLSDGDIHIYGPLRGRALAGARGNLRAHIFCQALEAELVAIAGIYQVYDSFPPALVGRPAYIRLVDELLEFSPLVER